MDYVLIIHPAEEGGYWAEVAGLDGCFAQGETLEDVIEAGRAAIQSHRTALREDGQRTVEHERGLVIATVQVPEAAPV